ncbi:MAG: N-acetylmuramoyl-L-alanine amidase [Lachnospiraceae bacterium]|nr:N-acetylmuramoyl-L-alanine amidase [Lachnospiraceae bacterium]
MRRLVHFRYYNHIGRINKTFVLTLGLFCLLFFCEGISARADEPLVIVIDPGHGGENRGGEHEQYTEKELTPIVANAMKEELEKYEGVEVYLTHDTDVDMSIKDRALFASEKDADFLFCLHFNMSVNHNLFGAEVWVPATGEYYSKGYSFAQIQMQEFLDIGLYSRGIKTRINDRNENYYGILRYCTQENIPSVLIEHCHLDHAKDQPFYQQGEEQLKAFGVMDATAVAKYFHLRSEILGVDYQDYPVPETPVPADIVRPDSTEPEVSYIEVTEINEETGEITVSANAEDSDSYILYYEYSLDGGNSYSELNEWPRPEWNASLGSNTFTVKVPYDRPIELRMNVFNGFDLWTESNIVAIDAIPDPERLKREAELAAEEEALRREEQQRIQQNKEGDSVLTDENRADEQVREITIEEPYQEEDPQSMLYVWAVLALILLAMIFVAFFMAGKIDLLLRGKKRR